jgi:hypothetical protein
MRERLEGIENKDSRQREGEKIMSASKRSGELGMLNKSSISIELLSKK